MGRGKALKTKRREALAIAEGEALGRVLGEYKANEKILRKQGIMGFVKTKIVSTLSNMDMESTIKAFVFGTTAITIYQLIQGWDHVVAVAAGVPQAIGEFFLDPSLFFANLFKELAGESTGVELPTGQAQGILFSLSVLLAYMLIYQTDALGRAISGGLGSLQAVAGFVMGGI